MKYCKRVTDFFAGFTAFSAIMYLFCEYMKYNFNDIESTTDKLKHFFSHEPTKDYRFYLSLIALLILSCVVSIVFDKFPVVTLAVSALPMIQIIAMFDADKIYDRPMLYILPTAIHMGGCLFECIRRDRIDRKRRAAIATDLLALTVILFCIYVFHIVKTLPELEFKDLNFFEHSLYYIYKDIDLTVFKNVAICYAVLAVIRLILRDLYYVDAILSVIPFVLIMRAWYTEGIPVFATSLVMLSVTYMIARFSIMLFCKPKCLKDQPINKKVTAE